MDKNSRIFVAGHRGLVGSAIVRNLKLKDYKNLIVRTRAELDLFNFDAVKQFLLKEKPEVVIDAAAKTGGIKESMLHHAEFLYENLLLQNSLIWASKEVGIKKFVFLGSSCIYPGNSKQPMKEEYFMTGKQEPTNEGYSIAKIAGMKLCEYIYDQFGLDYISCMPTNIYGPGDDFNPETSHVIPSLIRRMHEATVNNSPEVVIWGTGDSRREFLYVDDLADAIVWLTENYNKNQFLNVGSGEEISIKMLAETIKEMVGYNGKLVFDATKPDGMPRKLLDVSKLHKAGWHHKIKFEDGLKQTYEWYLSNRTLV
ncbi:MAG TPA: GDP-L-fucose synthase [Candidatus Saccharimonadales bacterium]|nr:GDP-L-fucose synthase [Candidatus Saccharimonadales bacterium]